MANDAEVSQYVNERAAMRAAEQDQPTYAWVVEGYVTSGTLTQYATDLRQAHYAGAEVGTTLWTGSGVVFPHTHQSQWDENQRATVRVWIGHVNGRDNVRDEAFYSLDGAA